MSVWLRGWAWRCTPYLSAAPLAALCATPVGRWLAASAAVGGSGGALLLSRSGRARLPSTLLEGLVGSIEGCSLCCSRAPTLGVPRAVGWLITR